MTAVVNIRSMQIQTEAAKSLLRALADDIGDDEQMRSDTVEGETNLFEAFDRAIARVSELKAYEAAIAEQIAQLQKRKERFDNQRETIRAAVLNAMADIGVSKIERPAATLSIGKPKPTCRIFAEADLPTKFLKEVVKVTPDKAAILEALKAGEAVPGAELANGAPTLSIRGA